MHNRLAPRAGRRLILILSMLGLVAARPVHAGDDATIQALIASGSFAEAEKLLGEQIPDPEAPVASPAAIQLEILRRTRHDFSLTADEVLREIKQSIPDATAEDLERRAPRATYRVASSTARCDISARRRATSFASAKTPASAARPSRRPPTSST